MRSKNELLERIKVLTPVIIEKMSNEALDTLTNGYDESLVRALILQGQTNQAQYRIFRRVKSAFDKYYDSLAPFVDRPDYMRDIQLDLECGMVLTDAGVKNENDTRVVVEENKIPVAPKENSHNIEKLEKENEELKAQIADLEEQLAEVKNKEKGISLGINQAQAALFGLSLANAFEFSYSNKKKELAPMLHDLFGWGQAKLASYLSTPCEKEEKEELANIFKDLCPRLYKTIMNKGVLPL